MVEAKCVAEAAVLPQYRTMLSPLLQRLHPMKHHRLGLMLHQLTKPQLPTQSQKKSTVSMAHKFMTSLLPPSYRLGDPRRTLLWLKPNQVQSTVPPHRNLPHRHQHQGNLVSWTQRPNSLGQVLSSPPLHLQPLNLPLYLNLLSNRLKNAPHHLPNKLVPVLPREAKT